jgi:hypothetical protein
MPGHVSTHVPRVNKSQVYLTTAMQLVFGVYVSVDKVFSFSSPRAAECYMRGSLERVRI